VSAAQPEILLSFKACGKWNLRRKDASALAMANYVELSDIKGYCSRTLIELGALLRPIWSRRTNRIADGAAYCSLSLPDITRTVCIVPSRASVPVGTAMEIVTHRHATGEPCSPSVCQAQPHCQGGARYAAPNCQETYSYGVPRGSHYGVLLFPELHS
jgi:hypothetical protein